MHPALSFLLLLLLFAAAASAAIDPSLLPEAEVCQEDLLMLSPCLPYVASQPNIPAPAPSAACCKSVSALRSAAFCLCYVVRDPFILGFPVNDTLVAGLLFSCSHRPLGISVPAWVVAPGRSAASFFVDPHSFYENCRGLKTLAPFHKPAPRTNHTRTIHPGANHTSPIGNHTPGTNHTSPANSNSGKNHTSPIGKSKHGRNSSIPHASALPGPSLDSPSVHKPGQAPKPADSLVSSDAILPGQAGNVCCYGNFLVAGIAYFLLSMIS